MFTRDQTGTVPNRIGPDRLLFTVWNWSTGPFWNRSGTDPKLDLQNSRPSFGSVWICSGQVPGRSRVNRRRCLDPFGTGPL